MFRLLVLLGVALFAGAPAAAADGDEPHVAVQIAGEPTQSSVVLEVRLDGPGMARFQWQRDGSTRLASSRWLKAGTRSDCVVKAPLRGLAPGALYRWRVQSGASRRSAHAGAWNAFHTLYPATRADPVSFALVSGIDQHSFLRGKHFWFVETTPPAVQPDRRLGYRALETIAGDKPLFVVFDGNTVYYDRGNKPGVDADSMRAIWHEQFALPRFAGLFEGAATYWLKDDHDFRFAEADRSGDRPPSAALGARIFREQVPVAAPGAEGARSWRTYRVNADLQIWLLESREERDPNAMEDTPQKSMWGTEQRDWLKRTLLASRAAWRVVITPTPLVGPDHRGRRDNQADPDGFRSEGEAFLRWAADEHLAQQGLVVITGDRPWQYHSIHPSGLHELSVGALNDQNVESGARPGSFWSTDPDGTLQQPYLEDDTGGFLWIDVKRSKAGSRLRATWFDEYGTPRSHWAPPPRP